MVEEGAASHYLPLYKEMALGKYGNGGVKRATRCPPKESVGAPRWQIVVPGGGSHESMRAVSCETPTRKYFLVPRPLQAVIHQVWLLVRAIAGFVFVKLNVSLSIFNFS